MSKLLDGKAASAQIREELQGEVQALGREVTLAVILVGNDPASAIYVRNKHRACEQVGIRSLVIELPENTSQDALLEQIRHLNGRDDVDGILVQLPLPRGVDVDLVMQSIRPEKDVDGFHPFNVGALSIGRPGLLPCTPAGIIELLKRNDIALAGKECVVVGRSNIVGKPVAQLLSRENATVTLCHSGTLQLPEVCQRADIVIVAVGRPKYIDSRFIREGAVVVDVGIHRDEHGHLCGDVDFASVRDKTSAITPVPGGVGPMTIAMLLKNCVTAAAMRDAMACQQAG
ncbi:bifunctional protein FolD [Salmonella enterica subsp. enterica serovar Choleraesuis]|nr:bifunctional protein FolD [Salmonella enterica subsp. enterica serovar Choleraesuis]